MFEIGPAEVTAVLQPVGNSFHTASHSHLRNGVDVFGTHASGPTRPSVNPTLRESVSPASEIGSVTLPDLSPLEVTPALVCRDVSPLEVTPSPGVCRDVSPLEVTPNP